MSKSFFAFLIIAELCSIFMLSIGVISLFNAPQLASLFVILISFASGIAGIALFMNRIIRLGKLA